MPVPAPSRRALAAVAVAAAAFLSSACAGADDDQMTVAAAPVPEQAFGPGCAQLPATGAGSLASFRGVTVLTAIQQSPQLTAFATLIQTAKAKDMFDSMGNVTVFAPTDDAFAQLPDAQKQALTGQTEAGKLLQRLIVVRDLRKLDLAAGTYPTIAGAPLTVTGTGDTYRIGGATLACGGITTANARLDLLDHIPTAG